MTHKNHKIKQTGEQIPPAQEQQREETITSDPVIELTNQLQRLQAEFDNYRKRGEAEAKRISERHVEAILRELLPIIDGTELCIQHYGPKQDKEEKQENAKSDELLTGITLIHKQLEHVLEHWGVTRIPAEGQVDPKLHEVYLTETTNAHTPGSIITVLQQGYTRNGTVLRTAKIKAARKE